MAKIKTEQRGIGTGKLQRFDYYCSASGQFSCKLPLEVASVLGRDSVVKRTLAECESGVRDALQEFFDSQTKRRKVILYGFACRVDIRKGDEAVFINGHVGRRCGPRCDEISFAKGVAVQLWVAVCEESAVEVSGRVQYSYRQLESSIPPSAEPDRVPMHQSQPPQQLMPWTKEREAFFARMVSGLDAVAMQLAFLSDGSTAMQIADGKAGQTLEWKA